MSQMSPGYTFIPCALLALVRIIETRNSLPALKKAVDRFEDRDIHTKHVK
jgi:hypothetical protein